MKYQVMLQTWVQSPVKSLWLWKDFECDNWCLVFYELHRNGTDEALWMLEAERNSNFTKAWRDLTQKRSKMEMEQAGRWRRETGEKGRMRMGQSCWSMSGQLRFSECSNNLKRRKAALLGKKRFLRWN